MARKTRRDPRLDAIGQRVAAAIVAELEAAGFPIDWQVYSPLLSADGPIITALRRVALERAQAAYQSRDEQRAAWAKEAGAVSWEDLQAFWSLSPAEMHAASDLGLIHEVNAPSHLREGFHTPRYYRAVALSEDQRAQIAAQTLLSRTDAAARLGVTPAAFDRLRKAHGLEIADRAPTRMGHMMALYRQTDVDTLAARLKHRPKGAAGSAPYSAS